MQNIKDSKVNFIETFPEKVEQIEREVVSKEQKHKQNTLEALKKDLSVTKSRKIAK